MAENPLKPKDDGKIGLPSIDAGMNKKRPSPSIGKAGKTEDQPDEDFEPLGFGEGEEEEILNRIRKRWQRATEDESPNRKDAVDDLKFLAGDQWPQSVIQNRTDEGRPALTIDKLGPIVRQVTNDQRQNRPGIDVSPVGDKSDPEAAKMFMGLIRSIQRDSGADTAYDTAFFNAAANGWGYWRMVNAYESEDSFHQVLRIRRIRNPFSVYRDPDGIEPDGSDWRFAGVTEMMPIEEFKDAYPEASVINFDLGGQGEKWRGWIDKDQVRVAEYYEKKTSIETLVRLENGWVGWEADLHEKATSKVVEKRDSERTKVMYYKVTAIEILDSYEWPGDFIPIYPVLGNEIDIEGKVKLSGVVRAAKDSQRMYNYTATAEVERWALAPKAPYIAEEGQLEGHETEWAESNTKSRAVLTYKGTNLNGQMVPPPQRQPPVPVDAAIVNARQSATADIMATTGIRFDPSGQLAGGDDHRESGKMLRERRRDSDLGSFHYMDNLARTLRRCGRDMVQIIPILYDEKRTATILREDGSEENVDINPAQAAAFMAVHDSATSKKRKIWNPAAGKYGVTVTIGPSYATKRIEAAESMMEFAKTMPQAAMMIADLIVKNMDWEGAEEIAARLAKALPPQLLTADQKDVPPQIQALIQNLQAQLQQQGQAMQQMQAALNEKGTEHAIAREKIEADFEAKILTIMQKAEDAQMKHMLDQAKMIVDTIRAEMAPKEEKPSAA